MQTTTRSKTPKKTMTKSATNSTLAQTDIIKLILNDHKPLKKLIKILKNLNAKFSDRKLAFTEFAPRLLIHAKPEEQSLYEFMKKDEDLRVEGLEGDTEHAITDQLINEIKMIQDEDVWTAKAKVLAELVEHHIEEEEEQMFPEFKKNSSLPQRADIGKIYLKLRADMNLEKPAHLTH